MIEDTMRANGRSTTLIQASVAYVDREVARIADAMKKGYDVMAKSAEIFDTIKREFDDSKTVMKAFYDRLQATEGRVKHALDSINAIFELLKKTDQRVDTLDREVGSVRASAGLSLEGDVEAGYTELLRKYNALVMEKADVDQKIDNLEKLVLVHGRMVDKLVDLAADHNLQLKQYTDQYALFCEAEKNNGDRIADIMIHLGMEGAR